MKLIVFFKILTKIAPMKVLGYSAIVTILAVAVAGCNSASEKKAPQDTPTSGTIEVSVDETYTPIIKEQLKVFDSSFPDAHVHATYKSEAQCFNDFINGKARMILVTRDVTAEEKKQLEERKIVPTAVPIAKDAVAVIMHNSNTDTVLSLAQIKGILTGQNQKNYKVVFDNQGSSTLRYMLDSIIPGEKLGSNVYAAKGNDSVVNYVAQNPDAIGFIGVSYVADYDDPEGLAFINKIKVAGVYNDRLDKAYKPYQIYIAPDWYPLTRNLYYIHRETYPGLATGFSKFLSKDRGQLIFKQSRLFPTRVNIIFREAQVNN